MDVDLNSDLGEGAGDDAALLALVTSANVACAGHAGSADTVRAALAEAARRGVVVGAHPGYADREHFGRRELNLSEEAIYELCVAQTRWLLAEAAAFGVAVRYVKPHGGLYNQACRDDHVARPVAAAATTLGLPLLALPASRLARWAATGCFGEGFADRRYRPDGSLVPRSQPDAFVADADEALAQAERLLRGGAVRSLCVHGDHPEALAFVRRLRDGLTARGFSLRAFA